MSTLELKNNIIRKIAEIEDTSFLKAIKTFIDSEHISPVYKTSDEQKEKVSHAGNQINEGECYYDNQVSKEIDEWLKSR